MTAALNPSPRLAWPVCCLVLVMLDLLFQTGVQHAALIPALLTALIEGVACSCILFGVFTRDLLRVSVAFLVIPYLLFFYGWLKLPLALLATVATGLGMFSFWRDAPTQAREPITRDVFLAFLVIVVWVNLSGAGGYGMQWIDYRMHNARLHDLVVYDWPLRLGNDQNFVYYLAYLLPAAFIGKLTTVAIALQFQFVWAVLGVSIALRWLACLSGWRVSFMLVLALVIFGPLDVLRYAWQLAQDADATQNLATLPAHWLGDFVFPPVSAFGFFIGNYLPNTFQLFWSPQQIIAGWIGVAMLTHLVQQQQWRMLFFIYSLLSLWAPMVMLAMAPLGLASLIIARKSLAQLVQLDTLVGAGMLFIIVGLYYAGGNIGHNLNFWLLARLTPGGYCALLVFHLAGWGLYTLSTLPFLRTQAHAIRVWFVGLVSSLALLPLHIFGAWSDLLCRGSAPLMFLLLVYLLQALRFYWLQRCHRLLLASVVLMALGSLTSAWMLGSSLKHYGQTQPVGSITWYGFPEENFGPDQSWFNDYLRKPAPPPPLAPP